MLCRRTSNNLNQLNIEPQKTTERQEEERLIISNRKKTKGRANSSKKISQNYSGIKLL